MTWTDRTGIVWRSEDSEVVISSSYQVEEELYRVVVNDEEKAEEQLVLRTNPSSWTDTVDDCITFAEGYIQGKEDSS